MQDIKKIGDKRICIFSLDSLTASYINGDGNEISKREIFDYFLLFGKDYYIKRLHSLKPGIPDFGTSKKVNRCLCCIIFDVKEENKNINSIIRGI